MTSRPEFNGTYQGFFVSVPLDQCVDLANLVESIPRALGRPVPRDKIHGTVIMAGDVQFQPRDADDLSAIEQTERDLLSAIDEADIIGAAFGLELPRLRPVGKYFGLRMEQAPEPLQEARSACAKVIKDNLGVEIDEFAPNWAHTGLFRPTKWLAPDRFRPIEVGYMNIAEDRPPIVRAFATDPSDAEYLERARTTRL